MASPKFVRVAVAALSMSAAGLVGRAVIEDYRADPYKATAAEQRYTVGFGHYGVGPKDKTDPVRALVQLKADIDQREVALRQCLQGVKLYQHEWDAYSSLAFNVGPGSVCASSIPAKLRAGQYAAACKVILDFNKQCWRDKSGARHCKVLPGLVKDRERDFKTCMGVAQ